MDRGNDELALLESLIEANTSQHAGIPGHQRNVLRTAIYIVRLCHDVSRRAVTPPFERLTQRFMRNRIRNPWFYYTPGQEAKRPPVISCQRLAIRLATANGAVCRCRTTLTLRHSSIK